MVPRNCPCERDMTFRTLSDAEREYQIAQITAEEIQIHAYRIEMEDIGHQDDDSEQDGHGILLDPIIFRKSLVAKEKRDDRRSVKRRNGKQVEEHKVQK